jgi:uncharacterized glyoxalase superfamily protein PhnB
VAASIDQPSVGGGLTDVSIWPVITCRDARAVASFLVEAFGFELIRILEDSGVVTRAELGWPTGRGGVMLREAHPTYPSEPAFRAAMHSGPSTVFVVSDDLPEVFRRAEARGAEVVRPVRDMREGVQAFVVLDPERNVWVFSNRTFGGADR